MAAVLSQYSTTGFFMAPFSKALMGCMFLTSTSIHLPVFSRFRPMLFCDTRDVLEHGQIWKLFCSRLAFLHIKDLVCGALLIYYFRVFERRMGSFRFASLVLVVATLATVLEVAVVHTMTNTLGLSSGISGQLPPGPYALLFPLYVYYFLDIPRVTRSHILGLPVTGKTLTYLIGIQMVASGGLSWISALCCLVACATYRVLPRRAKSVLTVPLPVSKLTSRFLSPLLESTPPVEGPIPLGATPEIQRVQQMDLMEQEMMQRQALAAMAMRQQQRNGADAGWFRSGGGGANARPNQSEPGIGRTPDQATNNVDSGWEVSPEAVAEQVQMLVDMGFRREEASRALEASRYDIAAATSILLQDPSSRQEGTGERGGI